nr:hypothetical protein Iba_chr03aCG7290 [Ipomoea batatas]GMD00064.1 hypothetical protein Iba_chr05eCG11620 [Ipomoea batatas]
MAGIPWRFWSCTLGPVATQLGVNLDKCDAVSSSLTPEYVQPAFLTIGFNIFPMSQFIDLLFPSTYCILERCNLQNQLSDILAIFAALGSA